MANDDVGWPDLPWGLKADLVGWASGLGAVEQVAAPLVVLTGDAQWVGPAVTRLGLGLPGVRAVDMTADGGSIDDGLVAEVVDLVSEVGGLGLGVASVAAAPIVSVLGPFVPIGQRLIKRWRSERPSGPDQMLRDAVRAIADQGPAVLFFGDLAGPELGPAEDMLRYTIRRESRGHLLGVCWTSCPELLEPERGVPGMESSRVVREVAPLTADTIGAWLGPMTQELTEQLLVSSGASTWTAKELWGYWRQEGHALVADGRYEAAISNRVMQNERWEALGRFSSERIDGLPLTDVADAVLNAASLTSSPFSGSALVHVVAEDFGLEPETVEDILDQFSDHTAVLDTTGDPVRDGVDFYWSYRWENPVLRRWVSRFVRERETGAQQERVRLANRLVDTGVDLHQAAARFHPWLLELLIEAGRTGEVDTVAAWVRADRHRAALLASGVALLAADPAPDLTRPLADLCFDLNQAGYTALAIRTGSAAVESAETGAPPHDRAWAHIRLGEALREFDPQRALLLLQHGTKQLRAVHHDNPIYTHDLGIALGALGIAHGKAGEPASGLRPLNEAVALHRVLHDSDPNNPIYTRNLGIALGNLGVIHREAGDPASGLRPLSEAVAVRRVLHDSDPENPTYTHDLGIALGELGVTHQEADDPASGLGPLNEAVALNRALHDSDPDNPTYTHEFGLVLKCLGRTHRAVGDPASGFGPLNESVGLQRALHDSDPDNPTYTHDLGFALGELGVTHGEAGDPASGLRPLNEAVALHRAPHDSDPNNPIYTHNLGIALGNLGVIHREAGDPASGLRPLSEAVALHRVPHDSDPDNPTYTHDLGIALGNLGVTHRAVGDPASGLGPLNEAVALHRVPHDSAPDNPTYTHALGIALGNLGVTHREAGDPASGLGPLNEAVALYRVLHDSGPDDPTYTRALGITLRNLGVTHRAGDDPASGFGPLNEAVALHRALHDSDPHNPTYTDDLGIALRNLGVTYRESDDPASGLGPLNEAVALHRVLHESGPDNPTYTHALGIALGNLGVTHRDGGDTALAISKVDESILMTELALRQQPGNEVWQQDLDRMIELRTQLES